MVSMIPALVCAAFAAQSPCSQTSSVDTVGTGTTGTLGVPELQVTGWPTPGLPFALRLEGAAPESAGWIFLSAALSPLPLPEFGATVYPALPASIQTVSTDAEGRSAEAFALPAAPSTLCGVEVFVQGAILDGAAAGNLAFSQGAALRFGSLAAPVFANPGLSSNLGLLDYEFVDLDGDQRLDLVLLTTSSIEPILIRRNLGNGQFGQELVLELVDDADSLAVADFDEDGLPEILLGTFSPRVLDVPAGWSGIEVGPPIDLNLSGVGGLAEIQDIHTGDIDGDGHLDAVFCSATGSTVWARGDGAGGFELAGTVASTPFGGFGAAREARLVDLDGDGHLDVVLLRPLALEIEKGDGLGGFTLLQSFPVPSGSPLLTSLTVGDLDGDGNEDVGFLGANVLVSYGIGDGTLEAPQAVGFPSPVETVEFADANDDGRLDLFVGYEKNSVGSVGFRPQDPSGSLGVAQSFGIKEAAEKIQVADVDFDGRLEMSQSAGSSTISWVDDDGAGGFESTASQYLPTGGLRVLSGDFDGNGIADLLVEKGTGPFSEGVGFVSLLGDGLGGFAEAQDLSATVLGSSQDILALGLADLNGDQVLDAYFVQEQGFGQQPSRLVALVGSGDGTFAVGAQRTVGDSTESFRVADVNADGADDLVFYDDGGPSATSQSPRSYQVLFGDAAQVLGSSSEITQPNGFVSWFGLGDLDGDGDPDFALSDNDDPFGVPISFVRIFWNDGSGSFATTPASADIDITGLGSVRALQPFDWDGDGTDDVVLSLAPQGSNTTTVARSLGGGLFAALESFPSEADWGFFGWNGVDLNGDDRIDLVEPGVTVFYREDGPDPWSEPDHYEPGFTSDFTLTDLDGDGRLDLVAVEEKTPFIQILWGR